MTQVLSGIAGIGIYPTVALCLFFAVFVGVVWRVARMEPREVARCGALPLDDGATAISNDGREPS